MRRTALFVLTSLAATSAFAWGDDCAFTAERRVELDAASLSALEVRAGAGDLEIRGEPGLKTATAVGRACASTQELLDQSKLLKSGGGDEASIAVELPESMSGGWFNESYAYIDLVVRVPETTGLDVTDSSGDTTVERVASLDVKDSSGDLTIRDIRGEVRVDDSSGDIEIARAGAVTINHDSSGDIDIDEVEHDAVVLNDSSGDIAIDDVHGNATVKSDSSGGIEFSRIRGNAEVGSDSSGGITATDIGGDFIVRSDGSGGISHDKVLGRVQVPEDRE